MLEIMKTWLQIRFRQMISALCERGHLALENLTLHHQITVLERSTKRPRFSISDRCFWILLSIVWPRWKSTLKIVQADTVR